MHNISLKHGSALNTRNDFRRRGRGKIASGVAVRSDSGVAGEGRVVGAPKFHSWAKCTMPLSINSDWVSSASSGLCIIPSSIEIFRRRRRRQPEIGLKKFRYLKNGLRDHYQTGRHESSSCY